MAGSPRVVTQDTQITWDGVSQRLPRGQVIDVPPGSQLEDAIGLERLVPLGATATSRPAFPEPAAAPAAPKPRTATGKTQKDDGGGEGEGT